MERAWVIDGDVIYSPNCLRSVRIPQHSGDVSVIFRAGESKAEDFQEPVWWYPLTEWTAFVPREPVPHTGVWFDLLNPVRPNKIIQLSTGEFQLRETLRVTWKKLEKLLVDIVDALQEANKFLFSRPFTPNKWKYEVPHPSLETAMEHIDASRKWFAMWIGLAYWMMKKTPESVSFVEGGFCPPHWFIQIVRELPGRQAAWDLARSAPIFQHGSKWSRVGVWLHHPDKAPTSKQPPARWFVDRGVPVWYRWGKSEGSDCKNPNFPLIIPSAAVLQQATTFFTRHPSETATDPTLDDFSLDYFSLPQDSSDLMPLDNNNPSHPPSTPQARENRERVKPTKSAKVFLWEWTMDDPPKFVKHLVRVDDRRETLERFCDCGIALYDSFLNEWHCTDDWEERPYETDDSDDKIPNLPDSPARTHQPNMTTTDNNSFELQCTQLEVLRLLSRFYGFVPPLPLPSRFGGFWVDADRQSLIAVLALDKDELSHDFFISPLGKICASFLRLFSGKDAEQKPNPELWDLSGDNRQTLAFSKRVSLIKSARSSSGNMWYMFDFENMRTVPWNLAVCSAAAALYVCRLNDEMTEEEIALDLVQEGIQFHTVQRRDTLRKAPVDRSSPAIVPMRLSGHIFDEDDVDFYHKQRECLTSLP
ncbi:hypothetical protein AN958_05534 [Leucoagaricus sp. SymC.cos]|nr:hypothetical protein AN958_05534 [Leucoagaricus sp. SymC.cos]